MSEKYDNLISKIIKVKNIDHFDGSKTLRKKFKNIPGITSITRKRFKPAVIEFDTVENKINGVKLIASCQNNKKKNLLVEQSVSNSEIHNHQKLSKINLKALENNQSKRENKLKYENIDVRDIVTPLHSMEYSKQIELKQKTLSKTLDKVFTLLKKETSKFSYPWTKNKPTEILEQIMEAKTVHGYRNKDAQTIGKNKSGEVAIGYRVGKFTEGSLNVESSSSCKHIPQSFKILTGKFESYLKESKFPPYSYTSNSGVWRRFDLKLSHIDKVRLTIQICDKDLDDKDLKTIIEGILQCFKTNMDENSKDFPKLSGILLQKYRGISNFASNETPCETLWGSPKAKEFLNGLEFSVSPNSFFQVNSEMAQKLFSLLGEWAECNKDTVMLDVCCGTGTIGISLAKKCKKVFGFEICEEAIEDAKTNMRENGVENLDFVLGKVEDTIKKTIEVIDAKNIVAIVDPPRAGLAKKVLKCLRNTEEISKIIYVSCNPLGCANNFAYLCKFENGKRPGTPFKIVRGTGLDLFPLTNHVETVFKFERLENPAEMPVEIGVN